MPRVVVPLYDRVLVRRVREDKVVLGGIEIPDIAKEKPQEGIVVAVGCGRLTERGDLLPLRVEVGARVLFAKYAGTDVVVNPGERDEHLFLREDEIMGVAVEDTPYAGIDE